MRNIKIGMTTEDQVNKEFIEAWHKAEDENIDHPDERLYFLDPATFFQVLSKDRTIESLARPCRIQHS